MSRRQTLGSVSPSQLNARTGAARSLLDTKLKTTGRPSLAPNTAPRRSSTLGGKPTVPGVKHDPRPIMDKSYQAACIKTILNYLLSHGYDPSISAKQLTSPTSKEYANIIQFLFHQVDPNLVKNFGKLEEEVPQVYKRLKYPWQLSKSALFAVGSPHTWPTLLAALVWLVELLSYQEKVDKLQVQAFDDKARCDADFFDYVTTSYRFFLAGDDATCAEVDEEKAADFQERKDVLRTAMDETKQSIEALQAQLQELRQQTTPLQAAQQRREEHLRDREKFQSLLDNLQSHKQSLGRKLQEREADMKTKQEQVSLAEQELEELKQRVARQTINRADVMRMQNEKAKQEEVLLSVTSQREVLDNRVHEHEVQVEKRLDDMEAVLQEYHARADRLQLIPASAKRAEGIQFEIKVNRTGMTANEMVNVDLKGTIKPALQRIRDNYVTRARLLSEELLSLAEKLDASQEHVAERAEENVALEQHVRKLEVQVRQAKEAMDASIEAQAREAERLQVELDQLRNATSHGVAESEAEVHAVQAELEQLQKSCKEAAAQVHNDLRLAIDALVQHKMYVSNKLKELLKSVEHCKAVVVQAHDL